jgi:hypothetical protein
MSQYTQLTGYDEKRLCLLIANQGPSSIFVSTQISDVTASTPLGIQVASGSNYTLKWIEHGELLWQQWYANCTNATILVWNWYSTTSLGDFPYGPCKTQSQFLQEMGKSKCTCHNNIGRLFRLKAEKRYFFTQGSRNEDSRCECPDDNNRDWVDASARSKFKTQNYYTWSM